MAFTITDFADLTARGLFLGQTAISTAQNKSKLLRSGFVANAGVRGAFAASAHVINFPVFNSTLVSYDLPADGSPVSTSGNSTKTFVPENVIDKIIPESNLTLAVERSVGSEAEFYAQVAQQIGYTMGKDIEEDLVLEAVAQATAESMILADYAAANVSYDALIDACSLWGDNWEPEESAIVVHPLVYGDLLKDPNVLRAQTSGVSDLSGRPVPSILGMPIVSSSRVPVNTGVYSNMIVRKDALMVYVNDSIRTKTGHVNGSMTDHTDYHYSYAVHVSRSYPTGVILLQTMAGV